MEHRDKIRDFVKAKVLSVNGRDLPFGDGDSVLRSGLLSSVSIVEVILFVEREFGLDITANDVQIEDFDSIDGICALLDRRRIPAGS